MSDRADKMKSISKLAGSPGKLILLLKNENLSNYLFIIVDKSASKIQAAFRKHQARLKLKKQAAWQIHEKLEYSSEQTESKVMKLNIIIVNIFWFFFSIKT